MDGVRPTATITGLPDCPADGEPGYSNTCGIDNDERGTLTFTWSEPVSGFTAGDLTVAAMERKDDTFREVTASGVTRGTVWTVEVTPEGSGSAADGAGRHRGKRSPRFSYGPRR